MDLKILFLLGVLVTGLPAEPPEKFLVDEHADFSVGLYFREYAVLSHSVNYITARQIVGLANSIGTDEFKTSQVETIKYPLFYLFDWNGDGAFENGEMFVDRKVEGHRADIIPYPVRGVQWIK